MQTTEQVLSEILEEITPKKDERTRIENLAKKLEQKVETASELLGVEAKVRLEGSVAKDTWLSEEPDIDIFMQVPPSIPRKSLGDICLKIAKKATEGSKQVERFADHPYLEAYVKGVRVNIVPCYKTAKGEWLSATDRTPFHTDYVKKHLTEQMRSEVRLLKRFMKSIGVYGAEIKIGGFSGYLCELLILNYQSFLKTLKSFAKYKQRLIVDIENHYKERKGELPLLFREPLVIIDPVDKGRNVASAVQPQKLYNFVAASRAFLKNPHNSFFYTPKTHILPVKELKTTLKNFGSDFLFLTFGKVNAVPDVFWGQLYKTQRSLRKLLELNDFCVLRDQSWSDEKTLSIFIFELEQRSLSPVKKHLGPPLDRENECESFLEKYRDNSCTVSGPYVENGRWIVEIKRKYVDAVTLINERLKNGGVNIGVADKIAKELSRKFHIFINEEIVGLYEKHHAFAEFLTDFLSGKPKWLETT